jgi:hypothetical protein
MSLQSTTRRVCKSDPTIAHAAKFLIPTSKERTHDMVCLCRCIVMFV